MENRVGDSVPPQAKLDLWLKSLTSVQGELVKFCITLTKDERRRMLRARKDSEGMIRRVYEIATKKGVSIPGIALDGMLSDVNLAERLEPFVTLLTLCLQLVEDTQAQADSESWQAFLAYYSVLSTMAVHDPEIAVAISPVTAAMRHARKRPDPTPEPLPTPEPAKP